MGREGVSGEMGRVTNGKVLAFGGVEVQLITMGIMPYTLSMSRRNRWSKALEQSR